MNVAETSATTDTRRHALMIGAIDTLAVGIAQTLKNLATSFAFDASAGDDAIRAVSEAQLSPERMRAVNFEDPVSLQDQLLSFEPLDCAIFLPRWHATGRVLELSAEDWDNALAQNVEEAIYTLQAIAKLLISQGRGGSIVVVSGLPVPMAGLSAVTTTHAALTRVCKEAATELAAHNITLNIVQTAWRVQHDLSATELEQVKAEIPLNTPVTAADVGAACQFLTSPGAGYLTGVSLPVDGGFLLSQHSSC